MLAAAFQTAKTDQGVAELYATHGAAVVLRFKEREETVRIDVVECFTNLVAATALASGAASGAGGGLKGEERPGSPSGCGGEHQAGGALAGLESVLPGAMAAAVRQLEKGKDEKTKSAVFALLRQVTAQDGYLRNRQVADKWPTRGERAGGLACARGAACRPVDR